MSKITLNLIVGHDSTSATLPWSAETSPANGLAICKKPWFCYGSEKPVAVDNNGNGWNTFEGWEVVHIRSGLPVPCGHLPSRQSAINAATMLAEQDWDKDPKDIQDNSSYVQLAKEVIRKYG